jgi:hypothetical protein
MIQPNPRFNVHAGPQLGRQYDEPPKTELGQMPGVAAQLQILEKNLTFLDEALRNLYAHLSPIRRDVDPLMTSEKAMVSEREEPRSELASRLANHNAFLNEISYSIIQVARELDI